MAKKATMSKKTAPPVSPEEHDVREQRRALRSAAPGLHSSPSVIPKRASRSSRVVDPEAHSKVTKVRLLDA